MTVFNLERISIGQVGIKPGSLKMVSSDNLVTITTAGYLNNMGTLILPNLQIAPSDVIECLYSYNVITDSGTLVYLQPSITNGVITLVSLNAPATITLANGLIFVGNASNVATGVALSGDATISNTGVMTIANNAITTAKILAANVTLAKLAAGITPSHIIKFAGKPTTVGGAAAEAFTVTGAVGATDEAFVQMVDNGTNNVTVLQAVVTNNTLTVTFSGDPGADTVFNYQIIRAAA